MQEKTGTFDLDEFARKSLNGSTQAVINKKFDYQGIYDYIERDRTDGAHEGRAQLAPVSAGAASHDSCLREHELWEDLITVDVLTEEVRRVQLSTAGSLV
jgi:hypothetical protein